ncbi:hypothetical protein DL95DRAFT_389646, partial [Leptodontidium sp. 2 PMI_412]
MIKYVIIFMVSAQPVVSRPIRRLDIDIRPGVGAILQRTEEYKWRLGTGSSFARLEPLRGLDEEIRCAIWPVQTR